MERGGESRRTLDEMIAASVMEKKKKYWTGPVPETCDLCSLPMKRAGFEWWVDGKVIGVSSWANMCQGCFLLDGVGLGTGLGQKYDLETKEKLDG